MADLFSPLSFARGPQMRNRLMLAPLTNLQSHDDGSLSDDELHWLSLRATGGFGLTMTCAATVQASGKGFPGQLGVHDDRHVPGLARLAEILRAAGSVSAVQLQHSGLRAQKDSAGDDLVAPWDDAKTGARAMTTGEVQQLGEDFILAGLRAQKAGFDGVELHGAHGYLLCEFFDVVNNQRTDQYGGSRDNRNRLLVEIIDGLRARAGDDFQIGVRLSPERFGISFADALVLAGQVMGCGKVDYLDMSLWDVAKEPEEEAFKGKTLLDHFSELPRGACKLGVAGKIMSAATAALCLDQGADFAIIGRAAILHHDFPRRLMHDPSFEATALPVSREYLAAEGLGEKFIDYMATWQGFVSA